MSVAMKRNEDDYLSILQRYSITTGDGSMVRAFDSPCPAAFLALVGSSLWCSDLSGGLGSACQHMPLAAPRLAPKCNAE